MNNTYNNTDYTADRLAKQFENYKCDGQLSFEDCFNLKTGELLAKEQKDPDEEMGR